MVTRGQESAAVDCQSGPFRQFDFWIGTWDVNDSTGKRLGTNVITRILRGCVIREQWTNVRNRSGESLNGYDVATKSWHQTWMDDEGNVWKTDGGLLNGNMVLSRTTLGAGKAEPPVIHRWTWSRQDANHLRQLYQVSRDGGKTWRVDFDGRYVRRR